MKANELKIKNWVLENKNGNDCYAQVKGITLVDAENTNCIIETKYQTTPIEYISPIPLTEEILLKCGFKVTYRSEYTLRLTHIKYTRLGVGWNLVNKHLSVRYGAEHFTHIKHLHSLQNIYWCLCGEELEINL